MTLTGWKYVLTAGKKVKESQDSLGSVLIRGRNESQGQEKSTFHDAEGSSSKNPKLNIVDLKANEVNEIEIGQDWSTDLDLAQETEGEGKIKSTYEKQERTLEFEITRKLENKKLNQKLDAEDPTMLDLSQEDQEIIETGKNKKLLSVRGDIDWKGLERSWKLHISSPKHRKSFKDGNSDESADIDLMILFQKVSKILVDRGMGKIEFSVCQFTVSLGREASVCPLILRGGETLVTW